MARAWAALRRAEWAPGDRERDESDNWPPLSSCCRLFERDPLPESRGDKAVESFHAGFFDDFFLLGLLLPLLPWLVLRFLSELVLDLAGETVDA